jgi:hypothetical protein
VKHYILGILACAILFLQPLSLTAAEIAGLWATSEGELTLTQQGNQITGSYPVDHGEVTGTLYGDLLEGYWIEDASDERCPSPKNGRYYWGRLRLQFQDDRFSGKWGYCEKELSLNWTGQRKASGINITGIWTTTEGEMKFQQSGSQVTGSYPTDHGEITGAMNGNTFDGYWIEDASAERCSVAKNGRYYWGKIHFQFDQNKFSGAWGYCDKEPTTKWTGSRK